MKDTPIDKGEKLKFQVDFFAVYEREERRRRRRRRRRRKKYERTIVI